MARGADKNSGDSQFFIVLEDSPFLDNEYVVFGFVIDGMDVVDKIKKGLPFFKWQAFVGLGLGIVTKNTKLLDKIRETFFK